MVSKSLSKDTNGYMQKTTINNFKEECDISHTLFKYYKALNKKLRKEKGIWNPLSLMELSINSHR